MSIPYMSSKAEIIKQFEYKFSMLQFIQSVYNQCDISIHF